MTGIKEMGPLVELELFHRLSNAEVSILEESLSLKSFPPGALLMTADQVGEAVYVIVDGSVKIFLRREDGNEVILAILGAGQTLGEMSPVDSAGRSADAVTMETSKLLWIQGSLFRECLKTMPRLSFNLVQLLSRRLRLANEQIQALSSLDVSGRVARQILAFADQYGRPHETGAIQIPLRLTQGDIAALVGTSREGVNRVLRRFKRDGLLSVNEAHHILVHKPASLAARCE